jgi:hypothetical protein
VVSSPDKYNINRQSLLLQYAHYPKEDMKSLISMPNLINTRVIRTVLNMKSIILPTSLHDGFQENADGYLVSLDI